MKKNKKLLLVEDEAIIALNLQRLCESKGYDVIAVVDSGEETLSVIDENQPDIILIDIILNGKLDGIETIEQVKKKYDIPYVFLTAHSDEKTMQRAKKTEPYGYILKPVNQRDLYFSLELALHKHQVDKQLKKSEELHRVILSHISDTIFITDTEGSFTYICPNTDKILGYSIKELKKINSIHKVIDTSSIDYSELDIKGEINNVEMSLTDKFNKKHTVLVHAKKVNIYNGTILYAIRDITERKQLQEKNTFQAELLNQIQDFITATDLNGTITYMNDITRKTLNISDEKLENMSVLDFGDNRSKGATQEEIIQTTRKEGSWRGLVVNYTNSGMEVYLDSRVWLLNDEAGQPTGMLGISTDITKLKNIENQLKEQKSQLQSMKNFYENILESVRDGIWVTDKNDYIIYTNSAMERIAGISREKIVGNHLIDDFAEKTVGVFKNYYLEAKQSLNAQEYAAPVITPSGRSSLQKGWLIPVIVDGKYNGIICTIQEITEKEI